MEIRMRKKPRYDVWWVHANGQYVARIQRHMRPKDLVARKATYDIIWQYEGVEKALGRPCTLFPKREPERKFLPRLYRFVACPDNWVINECLTNPEFVLNHLRRKI